MKDDSARFTSYTGMMKTAILTSGFEAIAFWLAAHYMTSFAVIAWIGFGLELLWFTTSVLVFVLTSAMMLVSAQAEKNK